MNRRQRADAEVQPQSALAPKRDDYVLALRERREGASGYDFPEHILECIFPRKTGTDSTIAPA